MIQAQSTIDEASAAQMFSQITDLVFGNLKRTLEINRLAPANGRYRESYSDGENFISRCLKANEAPKSCYSFSKDLGDQEDRTVLIDCLEANPSVKTYKDFNEAV